MRLFVYYFYTIIPIWIKYIYRIPTTVMVRAYVWILVHHRINTQPPRHQLVVHVPRTEIAVARFLV